MPDVRVPLREAVSGILLVGGASRRFGRPKALAELDGESLAARAWRLLAWCDERIAVGKAADALPLPFPVVDDGDRLRAPIVGLAAGLRAARNELCVVIPVDSPYLTPKALGLLADAAGGDGAVPQTGPLPGAYRRRVLPVLEDALRADRLSLREALAGFDVARVELDSALLVNVNTPRDLHGPSARATSVVALDARLVGALGRRRVAGRACSEGLPPPEEDGGGVLPAPER